MYRIPVLSAIILGVATLGPVPSAPFHPADAVERIAINDNRSPAGTLQNGVLTIRLEAREGEWHPDSDSDPGVTVLAFGEEGKALQIPGPLIRVTEGTEVRAFVRNAVGDETLTVHGLYARGAGNAPGTDTVQIKPSETREVRFIAGVPGTYYYWGATTSDPQLTRRLGRSTQLSGAIVVEPRGAAPQRDRVIVISLWGDSAAGVPVVRGGSGVNRIVINGRSWPHTERLRLPRRRYGPHAPHQRRRRRAPDASARLLLQRRQPRRRARGQRLSAGCIAAHGRDRATGPRANVLRSRGSRRDPATGCSTATTTCTSLRPRRSTAAPPAPRAHAMSRTTRWR